VGPESGKYRSWLVAIFILSLTPAGWGKQLPGKRNQQKPDGNPSFITKYIIKAFCVVSFLKGPNTIYSV
jgi:hypothetical protein